jgi:hypothetical protein
MHRVDRLSIREIHRRSGRHRKTIRRALASARADAAAARPAARPRPSLCGPGRPAALSALRSQRLLTDPGGRRLEVRVGQREITAVALDTGELAGRDRRCFADGLAFTASDHQRQLERLRAYRRRARELEVELRSLARYDALIPA